MSRAGQSLVAPRGIEKTIGQPEGPQVLELALQARAAFFTSDSLTVERPRQARAFGGIRLHRMVPQLQYQPQPNTTC